MKDADKTKILILIDDTACSIKAAQYGYKLARELNRPVVLVNVIEKHLIEEQVEPGAFGGHVELEATKTSEALLSGIRDDFSDAVPTEIYSPIGSIKETILETINISNPEMIVMGSHCRKGLQKLLLGSVAEFVVRNCARPVLVVPLQS